MNKTYRLVKSLTKSEKRYFSIRCRGFKQLEATKHELLFHLLDELDNYSAEQVLAAFKKQKVPCSNLSADMNYLYSKIMDSLREQYQSHKTSSQIRRLLDYADILAERGLSEDAVKLVEKAESIAISNQHTHQLPDIILTSRQIKAYAGIQQDFNQSDTNLKTSISAIATFNDEDIIYRKILKKRNEAVVSENPNSIKEIEQLLQTKIKENLPIHAQIRRLQSEAAYFNTKQNINQENETIKSIIKLMDKHPKFKQENFFEYITFHTHLLRITKQKNIVQYEEMLKDFLGLTKQVPKNQNRLSSRIFTYAYSTETIRLLNIGAYEKGITLIPFILEGIKQYKKHIPLEIEMAFYYKFAYFFFAKNEFEKSLEYSQFIKNEFKSSTRLDVFKYNLILNCITHYELNNFSLLEYQIRNSIIAIKNKNKYNNFDRLIFQLLKKIATQKNTKKAFISFKEKLKNTDLKSPGLNASTYFDFDTWVDSHIEGIPFREMKMKNLKKT